MPDERELNERQDGSRAGLGGTLVSAGVGLLLAGAAVFVIRQRLGWPVYAVWGAGAAALVAAAALHPRQIVAFLRGRGVRHGFNTALVILLAVAIAVLANYLALRHHRRFDLTRTQANTLSPQTAKILRGLQQPIEIIAFHSQGSPGYQEMEDLLGEYRYASPRVKTQVIDPEASPGLARQYGVTSYPTTVVEAGGQKEELYAATEQEITRAVLKLTRPSKKKIYFVQGHGEHDLDSAEPDGCGTVKDALTRLNYEVEKLALPGQARLPADCAVLVIAGPTADFDPRETDAVKAYLDAGGKALIMVDPDAQRGVSLADIIEPYGVRPLPDVVVEPSLNFFGDAQAVTVMDFANHDITRPFTRGRALLAVFVLVRAFDLEPGPTANVQDLVRTSADSWLETSFRGTISPSRGERRGPLTIAAVITGSPEASAEPKRSDTRLVVFGDSDFAANGLIANGVNQDLFLNSVSWLAEAGELVSIQPKEPASAPVVLTGLDRRIVFIIALIFMPLVPIAVGAIVWWRRR